MSEKPTNFIRTKIADQIKQGQIQEIVTRFPPEPNGYLHVGHAKSICLNFGLAEEFGGRCNLRFDDTNPEKESQEYIDAIEEDVRWLGFGWSALCHTADYFDQLFDWALHLIRNGDAYVDEQSAEEMRANRGTLTEPGIDSPYRDRSPEENEALFLKMRDGELPEGAAILRAKISMSAPNVNLRDPALYRIRHISHPRAGDRWCIYPTYDFAHGQSDAIENITHSLCTLEFEDHRPLYEWFVDNLPVPSHPRQIEFARLNLTHTVLSKRILMRLVDEGHVSGWDDPRMPTLSGMRRRGIPPEAIVDFCGRIGINKSNSMVEMAMLDACVREDLNKRAVRRMAVLRPLKVVIENYPDGQTEELDAVNNPEDETAGMRKVPFSRELYLERDDFMEDPPKKYFRMSPGKEVRLKYAYYVTCREVIKNEQGEITELICEYDPESRGGGTPDERKVKGTIQWVDSTTAINPEIRLYDRLFKVPNPDEVEEGKDYISNLNPDSLTSLSNALVEASIQEMKAGEAFQLERIGYFTIDSKAQEAGSLVLNRSVAMRDSWTKKQGK